jgi:cephalosporin-C deacetylase-like acetyl esterase
MPSRGLEHLLCRPEVERSSVVSIGNDVALMAGALGARAAHALVTTALFVDTLRLARRTPSHPLEEINDCLRLHAASADDVRTTLDYFNLRWTAPGFDGSILLMAGPRGSVPEADAVRPVVEAPPTGTTVHESESSSYKDSDPDR